MSDAKIISALTKGFKELNINLNYEPFLEYLKLLDKWNKAFNLTAIRDVEDMVNYHIMDSLAILPWVKGHYIIDVGTGAGLPGIPIALAMQQSKIFLLDSNVKKINFLEEVKRVLCLTNVEIVHMRVERFNPLIKFDMVITRAFSDLKKMIATTSHLLVENGILLAMKGKVLETELEDINKSCKIYEYNVPNIEAKRAVVLIS